jgi:glutamate dehydrogenase/leucine dehydrogenase
VITKKNYIVNMHQAAYAVAVDCVLEAMWLRGWV